jgi:hypothetical protein
MESAPEKYEACALDEYQSQTLPETYEACALDEYQSQTLKIKRFGILYLAILLLGQVDR